MRRNKIWTLIRVLPFYLFTFLLLTLSGCIEEYEADIAAEDSDLLVVEGTICSFQWNKFVLTRTQPLSSTSTYQLPEYVIGAFVSVRGTDGSEYVAQESIGNIYYYVLPKINSHSPFFNRFSEALKPGKKRRVRH